MKKHYYILGVLILLVAGLAVLAIHKQQSTPKALTVTQAVHQRDAALTDLKIQKALADNDQQAITNLTADKTSLTANTATLCAQIKAARLVQPLCK